MRRLILLPVLALTLAACSDSGDGGRDRDDARSGGDSSNEADTATDEVPIDEQLELVEDGFGQSPDYLEYVSALPIVRATGPDVIGQFVTVSVNFMGTDGALLGTETQVESFSWEGQELVLPVRASLSRPAPVAAIETTFSVSDHYGGPDESKDPLEPVVADSIEPAEYGDGYAAVFTLTNPTDEPLEDVRVGVVCRDAAGTIIGGTSDYPDLIAPGGQVLLESDVMVSAEPAECSAHLNYGDF